MPKGEHGEMKLLTDIEIKSILSKLYWDVKVDPEQLYGLLNGNLDRIGHIDISNLYYRILTTFDWYTILKIVPREKLGELLGDPVLNRIRFKDLKDKFLYARKEILQIQTSTTSESFLRVTVGKDQLSLKIDFVNDVAYHCGGFEAADFFHKIDSWRNILSNKLCAVSRLEPKDIADILFIAKKFAFEWPEIIEEAKNKDLWVDPLEVSRIIKEFPVNLLESVKWIISFDIDMLGRALHQMHDDIFYGRSNSLVG